MARFLDTLSTALWTLWTTLIAALVDARNRLCRGALTCLARAYGLDVQFDGKRGAPQDVVVLNQSFWWRVLRDRTLGFAEAYMDGLVAPYDLRAFIRTAIANEGVRRAAGGGVRCRWSDLLLFPWRDPQSLALSRRVAERHYDAGNDLFEAMLDPSLQYSCGIWCGVRSLEEAQLQKMRYVCESLELRRGMRVLDIGCGWGGLLHYMQTHYGVIGQGITLSREQAAFARERFPDVSVAIEDYRTWIARHAGEFDRLVSVGLFEHVGQAHMRDFFALARSALRSDGDGGLFFLQTIGGYRSCVRSDPFIRKYIFPGGQLPSRQQIDEAIQGLFVSPLWVDRGPDYALTLDAWKERADRFFASRGDYDDRIPRSALADGREGEIGGKSEAQKDDKVETDIDGKDDVKGKRKMNARLRYDVRFRRMWTLYLISCAEVFRTQGIGLWQIVLRPAGCRAVSTYRAPLFFAETDDRGTIEAQ